MWKGRLFVSCDSRQPNRGYYLYAPTLRTSHLVESRPSNETVDGVWEAFNLGPYEGLRMSDACNCRK